MNERQRKAVGGGDGLARTRITGPDPARRLTAPPGPPPSADPSPTRLASRAASAADAEPAPRPATGRPSKPVSRSDRLMVWAVLSLILLLALPPLLIDLRRPAVLDPRERELIGTAEGTWRTLAEQDQPLDWSDRLTPIRDGRSVFDRPPMVPWMAVLSLRASLETDTASPEQIAGRARFVSVLAALVAIAGVFWAGYAIGGIIPGALSALVIVGCPAFLYFGRQATTDMPTLAMTVLSVAAGLWAMRPHRRPPSRQRQGLGYTVCGLALGAAVLCGGPGALLPAFVPVMLIGLLAPQRAAHVTGLFAAAALALLLITPWAALVLARDPDAWRTWVEMIAPPRWQGLGAHLRLVGWRIVLVLLAILPWSLWLLFAIAQPFSTSSVGWRSRMFIGWAWFVTVFSMLLVLPGVGLLHEMLLALPAAAVLIGQLFRRLVDLSSEGRHARLWRIGRWVTVAFCLAVSVAAPLVLALQEPLIERGYLAGKIAMPMHWAYHVGVGLALVAITVAGLRYAARHYPGKALLCWAVWSVVLTAAVASPVARGPLMRADQTGAAPPGRQTSIMTTPGHGRGEGPAGNPVMMGHDRFARSAGFAPSQSFPDPACLI